MVCTLLQQKFSYDVVVMEQEPDDLCWYKCARFCSVCRYVQENYSVLWNFPLLSDLMCDLHRIIMVGGDCGCFAKHMQRVSDH